MIWYVMKYIDGRGYKRTGKYPSHSNLEHREIAYRYIYKNHRHKYPGRFSEYVVHHKDGDKRNNDISNLQLLTEGDHQRYHDGVPPQLIQGYYGYEKEQNLPYINNYNQNHHIARPKEVRHSRHNVKYNENGIFLRIFFGVLIFFILLLFMGYLTSDHKTKQQGLQLVVQTPTPLPSGQCYGACPTMKTPLPNYSKYCTYDCPSEVGRICGPGCQKLGGVKKAHEWGDGWECTCANGEVIHSK